MTGGVRLKLGDIFWDLATWIYYIARYDLSCTIYVANNTDETREYSLMSKVARGNLIICEGALPVHGHAWFEVYPGDLVRLHGTMVFPVSDAKLTVYLIERTTQEATDSVSTELVTPGTPYPWADGGTTPSNLMNMLLMMMMIMMMVSVASSALKEEKGLKAEEKKQLERV